VICFYAACLFAVLRLSTNKKGGAVLSPDLMAVIRETGMWNKFMPGKSIVTLCIRADLQYSMK
jgi:hypothetical protein